MVADEVVFFLFSVWIREVGTVSKICQSLSLRVLSISEGYEGREEG
jgi:hypothetical protein